MKKLYSITIRGKTRTWSFNFEGDSENLKAWREDGLEIDEMCNIIPNWIQKFGLTKVWCFLQDIRMIPLD